MALKGIDIFKMSPKKNCKECGVPTCMAFSMKVAAGALPITKCPYMGADVIAKLSEATAPPMKTIKVGDLKMGGETVLFRHEKTFVSKTLYAVSVNEAQDVDAVLAEAQKVDYERIGEREYVEMIFVDYKGDKDAYVEAAKKAAAIGREVILNVECPEAAEAALEAIKDKKPVLNGATAENADAMNALATKYGVVLGIKAATLDELHALAEKMEAAGNKNMILNASTASIKDAFEFAVQIRRACLDKKNTDRTFGYPTLVNVAALAAGDQAMQTALASLFTMKYGSIVVMEGMSYAQALPLYGLRQNLFTDPQKPMKVAPGIYPLNGADENAICCITVDFALTYFVVSGELERSGVPINMFICDAGGYSVLTAWAAGKLSASTIAKFVQENAGAMQNKTLILPGKVAVLQGEVKDKLPDWNVVIGPREAVELVQYLKEFK